MARRASSKIHPGIIIGVIALIVAAVAAVKWKGSKKTNSFANVPKLNIEEFLENGNSLNGNEYAIDGEIDEKLQWTSNRGQLVSVRINTPSGDEFIGVEIPQEFSKLNIDTKQKYHFKVRFRRGGIAVATGIERL
jgi:hypothetical protein